MNYYAQLTPDLYEALSVFRRFYEAQCPWTAVVRPEQLYFVCYRLDILQAIQKHE